MFKLNNKKAFLVFGLLIGLVFLAISPLTIHAFENTQKNIYIGEGEVIESNFIKAGGIVDFNGQAQKDVIIAGGTINITGQVNGDVIVVGGTVKIKSEVSGNVRVIGGVIDIDGKVGKNVNVFGGAVVIGPDAEIGWDVLVGAGSVEIRGKVGGNIKGRAESIILASEVGGDVDLKLNFQDGQLILYPQSDIRGSLTYSAPKEAEIKEGAKIEGETIYTPFVLSAVPLKNGFESFCFFKKIMCFLGLLVVGLIIIFLARKKSKEVGKRMTDKPLVSLGWGLIYLIITPIVLILISITIIGIPLALIVLALYSIALYISKIFVGIVIGQKVLKWWRKKQEVSLVWAMILGVILFSIIINIPFIGWIFGFLGVCWALGAMIQVKKETLKQIEK